MKLRLPHKFQAALLAAIASVSFTTLSTGTLGAAFFVSGHAFAEDTEEDPSATIDIGDTNLDAQAAMEEEEGAAETKEPGSAPINEAGFNGGPGNNAGLLITESDGIDVTALDTVASSEPVAVTSGSADSTPSDNLGFTANPYATGSDTSNGSDDFSLTGTAPAAAYVPGQPGVYAEEGDSAAGTGSGSSTNKTTTGDIGSIGGTGSGATGGSVARPMALTAPNMLSPVSSLSVGGTSLGGDSGSLPALAKQGAAGAEAQPSSSPLDSAVKVFDGNIASTLVVDDWTAGPMTVAVELNVQAVKDRLTTTWIAGSKSIDTIFNVQGTWNGNDNTYNEGVNFNGSTGNRYATPYLQAWSPNGSQDNMSASGVSESLKFNSSTPWDEYASMSVVCTFDGAETITTTWVIEKIDGTYLEYSGSKTGVKWGASTAFTPNGTLANVYVDMVDYVAVFRGAQDAATSKNIAKAVFDREGMDYGMTFSGGVFTIEHATNQPFHNATFSSWNQEEGERWKKGSHTWSGTGSTYYIGEQEQTLQATQYNTFWRQMFGDANSGDTKLLGNTIRLTRATGDVYYESQFGPFQIGGIIAEEGNSGTYVLGRHDGSCAIHIKAREGQYANMYVASNLGLSSNTSIDIDSSGTWRVFDGKSLTFALYNNTANISSIANTPKITFKSGVSVVTEGGGTVDMSNTASLTIESEASVTLKTNASLANLAGAGNLTVDSGTNVVTLNGSSNSYSGAVNVTSGTLDLTSSVNTGAFSMSGGTLKLADGVTFTSSGAISLTGGMLDLSNVTLSQGTYTLATSTTGNINYTGVDFTLAGGYDKSQYILGTTGNALTLTFNDTPVPPQESFAQKYGTTLGTVQFVGDSITHGSDYGGTHNGASYRWPMHKIWTDTGVAYDEDGYHTGNFSGKGYVPVFPGGSTYGGEDWDNRHSAQASGRAWQLIQGHSQYSGNTPASLVANYPSDVFFLMIGTNDTLSDYSNKGGVGAGNNPAEIYNIMMGYDVSTETFSGNSRMDTIVDTFAANAGEDSSVVVLSIPTWSPNHSNENLPQDFATMKRYNEILKEWCKLQGDNVYFVDVNPGIIDVANTTKPFSGVPSMFNDGLHPSGQGDLIFAGNIARQLGYAGRSVGLDRAAAGTSGTQWSSAASPSITVATGTSQDIAGATFTTAMGYTVDFGAVYGNGEDNGWDGAWDTSNINGLRVQVGDGTHTGTLTFSEAYVKWGDTVLYSRDNHEAGENFRIAYVNASVKGSDNVAAGYYVWMGDMLIGEALDAGTDSFNGIRLTSTGAAGSVTNLSWSDSAYAPTTTRYENQANAFHLVQVNPNPNHDNATHSTLGINFTDAPTVSGQQYATGGQAADANLLVKHTSFGNSWFGPAGHNHVGNVEVEYSGVTSSGNMFGVINVTVQGNVSTVIGGGSTFATGKYNGSGDYSIFGAYSGNITGKLSIEINNATMNGGVMMGSVNGNCTLGSTDLRINSGATITGDVIGGHHQANGTATTTGDSDITITGGTITGSVYGGNMDAGTIRGNTNVRVTGGIITGGVFGGNKTGGTIIGKTNVTIEGNLPSIGGDITADEVTLRSVSLNEDGYNDGFDWYSGTITGTEKITLDAYKVAEMRASLVTQTLEAKNSTNTIIHNLHLTACEVTVEAGSSVTLADTLTLGNTATYSGALSLQDNLVIDMDNLGSSSTSGAQSATSGYRSATLDVMKLAEGQSPSLTVHADTLQGAGALEGFAFSYDDQTGTLSAAGSDHTTYYLEQAGDSVNLTTEQDLHPELQHVVLNAASGTVEVTGTNTLTTASLAQNSALTFDVGGSLAVNGTITGTGTSVVKTGVGTMTISSDNSSTLKGSFTVSKGTVVVGNDLALGSMDSSQHHVELAGGTLDVNGFEGTGTGYTVEFSGGRLTNSGTGRGTGNRQLVSNALITGNSEINADQNHDMGFGTASHAAITVTFENDAVLEKTGTGTFWVSNATVSGEGAFKVSEGTVHFQKEGSYASDLELAGGTVDGAINLADNITVTGTGDGGTISATITGNNYGITKDGAGTVTLSGNNTYAGGTTVNAGTLVAARDNALGSGAVTVDSAGTLELKADGGMHSITGTGTVKVTDGDFQYHSQNFLEQFQGTVDIADGGVAQLGTATNKFANATLKVSSGGTIKAWGNTFSHNILLAGGTLADAGNNETYSGAISLDANSSVSASSGKTVTLSGAVTGNHVLETSGAGTVKLSATDVIGGLNATAGITQIAGSLTTDGLTGTGIVNVLSGGNLILSDEVTSITGTLNIQQGGTLTLGGYDDNAVATTGTLSLVAGSVVDVSRLELDLTSSNPVTLFTGGTITAPASGVEVRFGAPAPSDYTLTVDNNNLVLTFTQPDQTLIWDNDSGDNLWNVESSANWHKAGKDSGTSTFTTGSDVVFESGESTPTLATSITAGTMTLEKDAVVQVNLNSHTLSGTLAGEGTYGLLAGRSLGSVQMGNDWTGAVRIKDRSDTSSDTWMNNLSTPNSWLELSGFIGYDRTWATDYQSGPSLTANIRLTDSGDNPAWSFGPSSSTMYHMNATGKWEGTGEFRFTGNNKQGVKFTGDISGWNGKLTSTATGEREVIFADSATAVNVAIDNRSSSALNVIVGNAEGDSFSTTFSNAVNASKLTIHKDDTATFGNTAEIGDLTGSGNLVVKSGNEEVTINGITNYAGTTTVNSGTLYLTTTVDTIGTMTVNGGTLKLSEMGTSALVNTGTLTLGSDSTLDLSTLNISGTETTPITLVKGGTITSDYLNDVTLNFRDSSLADNAHLSVSGNSLVLTFDVVGRDLEWRDPSGTWGTANKWYIAGEGERRTTFQNGDNVSIKAPYDKVQIDLFANASAGDMTMEVVGENRDETNVTIANKDGGEYKLEAQNLELKAGTSLQTNVQMEVRETVQMADMTYWTINSPQNTTLAADISSTGDYHLTSITKQGDTTLVLTGDNKDYAGFIYVEDGTLAARSATALGTGEVYVENGATLSLERRRDDMTAGALTLAGGSTIAFVGDTMLKLDSLTLSDADAENWVTWDLSRYGFSDSHSGFSDSLSAILMDGLTSCPDDFQYTRIVTPNNIHDAALSYSNGQVILAYTMDPQRTLYWVGGAGEWSTDEEVKNWLPSPYSDTPTFFKSNDNVIFDRRAASSFVTLEEEITTVGTMTVGEGTSVLLQSSVEDATLVAQEIDVQGGLSTRVNVDAQTVDIAETGTWTVLGTVDREFHGEITGTGTLAKTGVADLQLSHANTGFHGDINLRGGSITAADTHALGQGSTIHMENGTSIVQDPSLSEPLDMGGNTVMVDAANATATISANMSVADGTKLTFAGDGNVNVAGTVSGGGTISQDSYGITTIQSIDGFAGTIDINHGTLALQNVYEGNASLNLGMGGTLQFAANSSGGQTATPLTLGSLSMAAGSYFDVSNITLGDVTFNTVYEGRTKSTTLNNAAILAVIPGGSSDDFPHSQEQYPHGTHDNDLRMIDGVTLVGTEHFGLDDSSYARLRYIYQGDDLVVYVQAANPEGVYWNAPGPEAEWINSTTKPTTLNWNTNADGTGTQTNYDSHTGVPEKNQDAYFFKKYVDGEGSPVTATITMNPETITPAGDVIFGEDTKYTINGYLLVLSGTPNAGYENKEKNFASSLIVRDGAEIALNAAVTAADGTSVDVHEGGSLVITADQGVYVEDDPWESVNAPVQIFNGHNAGYTQIDADGFIFKRYSNEGEMHVTHTNFFAFAPEYSVFDSFSTTIEYITNMESGVISFSSDYLIPFPEIDDDYDPNILNDGQLYFYSPDVLGVDMFEDVPVRGRGEVYTGGEHGVIFNSILDYSPATVQASRLDLDAAFTTFNYGVDITDSTLVRAGKVANFFGGGISGNPGMVGDVGLENGLDSDHATRLVFGPQAIYVYDEDDEVYKLLGYNETSYKAGQVMAGTDSRLTVEKGATVTMDGFNAAGFVPAGEIEVGTIHAGAESETDFTASLTIEGAAAVDTITMHSGTMEVKGNANINRIMQEGGKLSLDENSTLNGLDDEAHGGALTGGTVSGGTLELKNNMVLTQNAVVDVQNDGNYTIVGAGSMIDATGLELEVEHEYILFRQIVDGDIVDKDRESAITSGFMCSGDEYVKLFDVQYEVDPSTGERVRDNDGHLVPLSTLISNDEQVYHSSASGMMTLIGNDNWEEIRSHLPTDLEFDVQGHIGYGYLHTSDLALQTYYVRDLYTETVAPDPENPEGDPLAADRVTLDDIFNASKDEESQIEMLSNVVFDLTDRNRDYTDDGPYNGTLTVNRDTSVDLFSVTSGTRAAINIIDGKTVTASEDSPGMAGNLDLEGKGVYEIENRNDLGQNIAVRDELDPNTKDWDGTVRVTGTSTDLNIDNMYADKDGEASTIEFKKWNGALDGGEHENNAKIVLTSTQDSPTAMKLTGEDDIDYTFTNTVTGGGNINHAEGGNVAMTFSGDTKDWDGTYEQNTSTNDSLTFSGGSEVNAGVNVAAGTMDLTYDGTVTAVKGDVRLYSSTEHPSNLNVTYNGESPMTMSGAIETDGFSNLAITVGDGSNHAAVTFSGTFTNTDSATMTVKEDSIATIDTNASLLRVVGEEGSTVNVTADGLLNLTSTNPERTYSQFYGVENSGTIQMQAAGGDIKLIDNSAEGKTYNLGNLVLVDPAGTAAIETSGVTNGTTEVNITNLTGPKTASEILQLTNDNATGTVNYNLGGDTEFRGTIEFGSDGATGDANVVLDSNGVAANAVLKSIGTSEGTADVVVNTTNASVQGIDSAADATVGGTLYGEKAEGSSDNRKVTITGDGTYSYNGGLGANLDIEYNGDGTQTFEGGVANFNGKVTVENGSNAAGVLEILNASSVSITDLTIGANDTLNVKFGAQSAGTDGTATVSRSVVALGGPTEKGSGTASKMDGNLTLGGNASYDVSNAGGMGGLDLGGELTISTGATLSSGDIAKIYQMEIGDMYDLAFSVTMFNGSAEERIWSATGSIGEPIDASELFGDNQFSKGEYYVCYSGAGTAGGNGSNVGTVYLYKAMPEPTTSTLSLLALAALAARRRRK